jgi:putative glutamine amidotransferase
MPEKRIAITFPKREDFERRPSYRNYIRWVESVGLGVVPIFLGEGHSLDVVEGLLLSGGGDVDPSLYGDDDRYCENVSLERDRFELDLLKAAIEKNLAILGICRGHQIINVYFGGTLYQDLERELGIKGHSKDKGDSYHPIELKEDSKLGSLLGKITTVNSSHHQAVKELGEGLRVVAKSPDGVVEALEHTEYRKLLTVQWHPERWEHPSSEKVLRLFLELLNG